METPTMGRVLVQARMENLSDLYLADEGVIPPEQVRAVEVDDALVDTGATMLSLPERLVSQLGLKPFKTRRLRTTNGIVDRPIYGAVRLTIQGRWCNVDVAGVPDDCPVMIGQIPLEALDWVVDTVGQRLIGNPEHNGEHMADMY
jgi:predicted aspartyl protease